MSIGDLSIGGTLLCEKAINPEVNINSMVTMGCFIYGIDFINIMIVVILFAIVASFERQNLLAEGKNPDSIV